LESYHFPQILHLSPWLADRDNAVIEDTAASAHLIVTGFSAARVCSIVEIPEARLGEAQTAQMNILQAN
jgi:hypothetical protein